MDTGEKAAWSDITALYSRLSEERPRFDYGTIDPGSSQVGYTIGTQPVKTLTAFISEMKANRFLSTIDISGLAIPEVGSLIKPLTFWSSVITTIENICAFDSGDYSFTSNTDNYSFTSNTDNYSFTSNSGNNGFSSNSNNGFSSNSGNNGFSSFTSDWTWSGNEDQGWSSNSNNGFSSNSGNNGFSSFTSDWTWSGNEDQGWSSNSGNNGFSSFTSDWTWSGNMPD